MATFTSVAETLYPIRNGMQISAESLPKFCDIGVNLCDEMYFGIYNDKQRHENDMENVLQRSKSMNIQRVICTAGSLDDSRKTFEILNTRSSSSSSSAGEVTLAQEFGLFMTVGIHPTRADEFLSVDDAGESHECHSFPGDSTGDKILDQIINIIHTANTTEGTEAEVGADLGGGRNRNRNVVALGECGLDYARLKFCTKEQQLSGFLKQLSIASHPLVNLPLFLHSRDTEGDFLRVMRENYNLYSKRSGVVHSYDGSIEEMLQLCELGLYIGINGCSLRTVENHEMVKAIPSDKLLLETDAPWCGIKQTHPSYPFVETHFPKDSIKKKEKWVKNCLVKDRNEPCYLHQVAEVVANIRQVSIEELSDTVWTNTTKLFFYDD